MESELKEEIHTYFDIIDVDCRSTSVPVTRRQQTIQLEGEKE